MNIFIPKKEGLRDCIVLLSEESGPGWRYFASSGWQYEGIMLPVAGMRRLEAWKEIDKFPDNLPPPPFIRRSKITRLIELF